MEYVYNSRGNLRERKKFNYQQSTNAITYDYLYRNSNPDELMYYFGIVYSYDTVGNMIYRLEDELVWSNGRNLVSYTENALDETIYNSYTYDEKGIRTSKTVDGVTTYFNTKNGVILSQTDGTDTLIFQYDATGTPLGFIWNGTQYFYLTNQMGDVIGITDNQGDELVQYEYDEWGVTKNVTSVHNTSAERSLGYLNPLRYRGYYYDCETGLYYLQSRYYDPSICRFINADTPEYVKLQKNDYTGINSFVYCCNDPVNNADPTGYIINLDYMFGNASIVSSILSAVGTILLIALKKTPWGKIVSAIISFAAIASHVYSYSKAMSSAKRYYGKGTYRYKMLRRYNNVVLIINVAIIIISDILSARFVRNNSTKIALALLGCRTITIVGLSINIGELLSGKSVIYRSRFWR